jgi:hypothetical protein
MNKLTLWASGIGATVLSFAMVVAAHAQSVLFSLPTSTAPGMTADVGAQLSDPGTLLVIGVIAGIYLFFYVVHQLIGLVPKGRGSRR